MTDQPKRIALWGGSFNPPTIAHKALSLFTFNELRLDALYWIVSPHNPEKDIATLAPFKDRYVMVQQLLHDQPAMIACDIEETLGSSLTVNTVRVLRKQMPDNKLFFMMGGDNWLGFHQWAGGAQDILEQVSIIVLNRPGFDAIERAEATRIFADKRVDHPDKLTSAGSWYVLDNPSFDMSATQVRHALQEGQETQMIAPETLAYIQEHNLYKKP